MVEEMGRTGRTTVVLDRDGTLLDFYEMFHRFVLDLHRQEGVIPPPREEILGFGYWSSITSGALHIGSVRVRDRVDEVAHRYMAHGTLYPGVVPMLSALSGAGVRLALVSSWVGTEATVALLERYAVRPCFGPILTRDDLDAGDGPVSDADCKTTLARRALDGLGHAPDHRLYVVGDTPSDIALGRRLGAVVVGVRTGNGGGLPAEGTPEGPDVLLPSAADLGRLILQAEPVG
ncbi:HAD family hydrolase [Streptomyces noursei]|uniref:HAD family hydrolase n=1 Tax=Streptomyces noursei TaxID=1971 RepID=UPI001F2B645E|nr:HAD family hydrolase [Streptomyces noursei]